MDSQQKAQRKPSILGIVLVGSVILFLLTFGTAWMGLNALMVVKWWDTTTWPTTQGQIVESTVIVSPSRSQRMLSFRYEVDTVQYSGDRLQHSYDVFIRGLVSNTAQKMAEFKEGQIVAVYFNPSNHTEAVLRNPFPWLACIFSLTGLVIIWISIKGLVSMVRTIRSSG